MVCLYIISYSKLRFFRQFCYRSYWYVYSLMAIQSYNQNRNKFAQNEYFPCECEGQGCSPELIWVYVAMADPYGSLASAWSTYLQNKFLGLNMKLFIRNPLWFICPLQSLVSSRDNGKFFCLCMAKVTTEFVDFLVGKKLQHPRSLKEQ